MLLFPILSVMKFKTPISNILDQIANLLDQLTDVQYVQPIKVLSGSTLGQHIRHILEFLIELDKGYSKGIIDYDQRERNHNLETNKEFTKITILQIKDTLLKPNQDLLLQIDFINNAEYSIPVSTNYFRELVYNLEHAVHHMALIRIGVQAISEIELPHEFGVASSTIQFRKACAQ